VLFALKEDSSLAVTYDDVEDRAEWGEDLHVLITQSLCRGVEEEEKGMEGFSTHISILSRTNVCSRVCISPFFCPSSYMCVRVCVRLGSPINWWQPLAAICQGEREVTRLDYDSNGKKGGPLSLGSTVVEAHLQSKKKGCERP